MSYVFAIIVTGFLLPLIQLWILSWFASGSYTGFMIVAFIISITQVAFFSWFFKLMGFISIAFLVISLIQVMSGNPENLLDFEMFGFCRFGYCE